MSSLETAKEGRPNMDSGNELYTDSDSDQNDKTPSRTLPSSNSIGHSAPLSQSVPISHSNRLGLGEEDFEKSKIRFFPYLVTFFRWTTKAPCCIALCILLIPIIFSLMILVVGLNLETDNEVFVVRGDTTERTFTSQELADEQTVFRLSDLTAGTSAPQSSVNSVLTVYFEDQSSAQNVFTNSQLDSMLETHRQILNYDNGDSNLSNYVDFCLRSTSNATQDLARAPCFNPVSVLTFFYPATAFTGPAPPPRTGDPDVVLQDILNGEDRDLFLQLVGEDFTDENRQTRVTRATFSFAFPLEGFSQTLEATEEYNAQVSIFENWIFDLEGDILSDQRSVLSDSDLRMTWLEQALFDREFTNLFFADVAWSIGAVGVLFFYMWFHTASLFLTLAALAHIALSFPLAVFIFRVIYDISLFPFLNAIGIYIILGIGADDVFIFLDAWKQSKNVGEEISQSLETRMAWTYSRAPKAMLITSLTTAVAFFFNAVSEIPAIAMFGIFTGTMIMVNYALVITYFPMIVLFWAQHLEHRTFKNGFGFKEIEGEQDIELPDSSSPSEKPLPETESDTEGPVTYCFCFTLEKPLFAEPDEDSLIGKWLHHEEKEENIEKDIYHGKINSFRILERFFYNWYIPFLSKTKYFTLAAFIVLIILSVTGASFLGPSDDPTQFLPDSHPLQVAVDLAQGEFARFEALAQVQVYWGIDRLDTSNRDTFNFNDRGVLIYDNNFDFSLASSQQFFLDTCQRLRTSPELEIRLDINGQPEIICFLEDFNAFHGVTPPNFITGDQFIPALQNFTENFFIPETITLFTDTRVYEDTIGFDIEDGGQNVTTLRYVSIIANLTLDNNDIFTDILPVFDEWQDLLSELNQNAQSIAPQMSNGFQTSDLWVGAEIDRQLLDTAVLGITVSLILAFVIILISTRNIIVAFMTVFSIGSIVSFVLAFIVLAGWGLGVIESIVITILVGLSVDYVTHVGNSINESKLQGKFPRVRDGMTEIGISIFSSAFTTIFSSIFLLGALVIFFFRFGAFLILTILLSALYGFIFYPTLVLIFGPPNSRWGNIYDGFVLLKGWYSKFKKGSKDTVDLPKE